MKVISMTSSPSNTLEQRQNNKFLQSYEKRITLLTKHNSALMREVNMLRKQLKLPYLDPCRKPT